MLQMRSNSARPGSVPADCAQPGLAPSNGTRPGTAPFSSAHQPGRPTRGATQGSVPTTGAHRFTSVPTSNARSESAPPIGRARPESARVDRPASEPVNGTRSASPSFSGSVMQRLSQVASKLPASRPMPLEHCMPQGPLPPFFACLTCPPACLPARSCDLTAAQ